MWPPARSPLAKKRFTLLGWDIFRGGKTQPAPRRRFSNRLFRALQKTEGKTSALLFTFVSPLGRRRVHREVPRPHPANLPGVTSEPPRLAKQQYAWHVNVLLFAQTSVRSFTQKPWCDFDLPRLSKLHVSDTPMPCG